MESLAILVLALLAAILLDSYIGLHPLG